MDHTFHVCGIQPISPKTELDDVTHGVSNSHIILKTQIFQGLKI